MKAARRRRSSLGHRKLDPDDRILLFLIRMRRGMPFEGLGILFGIANSTAFNYYTEILDIFHDSLVPRLLRPFTEAEIDAVTPPEWKEKVPGGKFAVDLTAFKAKARENVVLQRLLYSPYHHQSEFGAVFGNTSSLATCILVHFDRVNSFL